MAVCAIMMFAGCGADAHSENPVPTITVVDRVESVDKPELETKRYNEAGLKDFEFGDKIWNVETNKQSMQAYLVLYIVVGQRGDVVEAIPNCTNNIDEVREVLSYDPPIYSFAIDQIYRYEDAYEAETAVAKLNGDI
jgi:hypothetical protein